MRSLITLFILYTTAFSAAEFVPFEGRVLDEYTGAALPFVEIILVDSYRGTYTDQDGRFRLDVPVDGEFNLIINHIGYQGRQVSVDPGETRWIQIGLEEMPLDLEEILVWGDPLGGMNRTIHQEDLPQRSPRDVGDFFVGLPGASAVKKGGYAQDPNLRGMRMDQLNVQVDGGVKTWGGCPNRMDPPTSHIQADDLSSIELVKGPFSVRWGPTAGGIVNMVMQRPGYTTNDFKLNGSVSTAYDSNGDNLRNRLQVSGGSNKIDFYLGGGFKQFGDYRTGVDSIIMPADYSVADVSTKLAWKPSMNSRLQVSGRYSEVQDVDFPALPMDARLDQSQHLSFDYSIRHLGDLVNRWSIKYYQSDVHHLMDNRDRANFMMVEAVTTADTRTRGGRTELELSPGNLTQLWIGGDYYDHGRKGERERFVKTNPCMPSMHPNKTFVDPVWPEVFLNNLGVFAEMQTRPGSKLLIKAGARLDRMNAGIDAAPDQFVDRYGEDTRWDELRTSWTASAQYRVNPASRFMLAYGRGSRGADLTERFIYHLPVGRSPHEHFGNPDLKPEINDQVDLSWQGRIKNTQIMTTLFASSLQDMIFAREDSELKRLYMPCNEPSQTKVFENVSSARRLGLEFQVQGNIAELIRYQSAVAYTRGDNLTLDEALPEIPPLEGTLNLSWPAYSKNYHVDLDFRWVAAQERISTTYGETETDGFSTVGLGAGIKPFNWLEVDLQITNLFDVAYSEHLNRNFAGNTAYAGIPLYEAGRNVSIGMKAQF